jgi:hypothetical protein
MIVSPDIFPIRHIDNAMTGAALENHVCMTFRESTDSAAVKFSSQAEFYTFMRTEKLHFVI